MSGGWFLMTAIGGKIVFCYEKRENMSRELTNQI